MKVSDYNKLSLGFINKLEGYKTVLKNLHWSAVHLTSHRLIDDLLSDVIEFQDTIAECSQGYMKAQFNLNDIKAKMPTMSNPNIVLDELIKDVDDFCDVVEHDKGLRGVNNAVNDFQQSLLKYRYLFILSNKDGVVNTTVTLKK